MMDGAEVAVAVGAWEFGGFEGSMLTDDGRFGSCPDRAEVLDGIEGPLLS